MDEIQSLRARIDAIDVALVELLNARAACAFEIGRIKHLKAIPVYQPDREAEVLTNVRQANAGPLSAEAMRRVFERIIDEARRLERVGPEPARGGGERPAER